MKFLNNLIEAVRGELPARPANGLVLSSYRKPWWNYWAEGAGNQFFVVGGPKRKAIMSLPYVFPDRPIARAVAKYMTRSARIRVTGERVT